MIYVLHIYQNRNCVRVGLFWRHGRCCCDCNLRPSWRHGFCQLSVFSIFLEVLLFFVSAYGWIISSSWEQFIDFMIKDCRVRRSDKSLFKTELLILFEKKYRSTRTLRKFIPGNCRWNWSKLCYFTFHEVSFRPFTGNGKNLINLPKIRFEEQ